MPRGRPPKGARNIFGLQNQQQTNVNNKSAESTTPEEQLSVVENKENLSINNESSGDPKEILTESGKFFFRKAIGVDFGLEGEDSDDGGDLNDEEQESETEEWDDDKFQEKLYDFAVEQGDDSTTFADAKEAAEKFLDACPSEVIRRFINRSWRFMSAYRKGLTGNAAAWAIQKQSKHRVVSERAMMSIEAVLN